MSLKMGINVSIIDQKDSLPKLKIKANLAISNTALTYSFIAFQGIVPSGI